jgi:hypothetical protein
MTLGILMMLIEIQICCYSWEEVEAGGRQIRCCPYCALKQIEHVLLA